MDELRRGGAVADHDEHRRRFDTGTLPGLVGFLVVFVECMQRRLQLVGKGQRIAAPFALYPQILADMFPEVSEDRHVGTGDVVGHRHPRQFDDAAFDGVDEGEIADRPGKEGSLGPARAAQKKRRRRQIIDGANAKLAFEGLDPVDPELETICII